MSAIFDRERLDVLVAEGLLRSQRHPEADLWIYNYTERTQYENHWTPETLACRGLILDTESKIVARPFAKFFNYGTPQAADLPVEPFTVTEKIDGSLGILYYLGGQPQIATRGSFISEQAMEGTRMLADYDFEHADAQTPLFEIIYPENRIVVDYGGRRELVLLAVIDNATGRESCMGWSGLAATRYDHSDIEALAALEEPNREGFVVAFESGVRVKVKFAEYVRLHKIVTGVNARNVWEAMRDGDDLDSLLDGVPDEIYDWITRTRDELQAAFDEVELESRLAFDARPGGMDRKQTAEWFKVAAEAPAYVRGPNLAVLFKMLDGKPYADLIWKNIRPEPETPASILSLESA
jgi:RNA ligase